MRSLPSFLVLMTLALVTSHAFACRPMIVPVDERVASSQGIYIGEVTGKVLTEREGQLQRRLDRRLEGELIQPVESEIFSVSSEGYSLRVFVTDRLKGPNQAIIDVPVPSCGSGYGELGDHVVVFQEEGGKYYISPESDEIEEVRKHLATGGDGLR